MSGSSVASKYMSLRIEKLNDILKFLFRQGNLGVVYDKKVLGPKALWNIKYNFREFTDGQLNFMCCCAS